jgi:hypothetical protein
MLHTCCSSISISSCSRVHNNQAAQQTYYLSANTFGGHEYYTWLPFRHKVESKLLHMSLKGDERQEEGNRSLTYSLKQGLCKESQKHLNLQENELKAVSSKYQSIYTSRMESFRVTMSHTNALQVTMSHIKCSTLRHSCKWKVSHTESPIDAKMEDNHKRKRK